PRARAGGEPHLARGGLAVQDVAHAVGELDCHDAVAGREVDLVGVEGLESSRGALEALVASSDELLSVHRGRGSYTDHSGRDRFRSCRTGTRAPGRGSNPGFPAAVAVRNPIRLRRLGRSGSVSMRSASNTIRNFSSTVPSSSWILLARSGCAVRIRRRRTKARMISMLTRIARGLRRTPESIAMPCSVNASDRYFA